ncbi:hypothetical protein [Dongia sp.]|uniref:hypothetical protein n=1 Tax=Dongia sp. TaxID=1977262 RepID=UPI0035B4F802
MIRLRAKVSEVTGRTKHLAAGSESTTVSPPYSVEIVEGEGEEGVLLFRLDRKDVCLADTWHKTVDAAKAQAKFEYGIEDHDWEGTETS